MKRLTDSAYWDVVHKCPAASVPAKPGRLQRLLGPRLHALTLGYADHLVWDVLYPRYLGDGQRRSAIEIGSAPGSHLVQLRDRFGFDVFGVEYSVEGADLNRRVFADAGLEAANIIQADFFSDDFQRTYAERFDVVISRGFIEHFTDMDAVIRAHLAILRSGGVLVVSIPNLRGINHWFTRLFHPETIALHNLDIMTWRNFHDLFQPHGLEDLFCAPFGIFDFGLFNARLPGRARVLKLLVKFQRLLNLLFRLVSLPGWWEGRWHSPYFLYIGRKP